MNWIRLGQATRRRSRMRDAVRSKHGTVTDDTAAHIRRLGWSDGRNESFAHTEADRHGDLRRRPRPRALTSEYRPQEPESTSLNWSLDKRYKLEHNPIASSGLFLLEVDQLKVSPELQAALVALVEVMRHADRSVPIGRREAGELELHNHPGRRA